MCTTCKVSKLYDVAVHPNINDGSAIWGTRSYSCINDIQRAINKGCLLVFIVITLHQTNNIFGLVFFHTLLGHPFKVQCLDPHIEVKQHSEGSCHLRCELTSFPYQDSDETSSLTFSCQQI